MFVIGCAGQCQNGKDLIADRLQYKLNESGCDWKRVAFAANVKKVFCETFGVDLDFVEKWKVNPEVPPGFAMPIRQSLQFIGDGFRTIQPTIWLDLAFRDKSQPVIISDVRYCNEFIRVKEEGGLNILIARPDKLNDDPNGSEAQIRPYVDCCLSVYDPNIKFVVLNPLKIRKNYGDLMPPNMDKFDVFIRNDGTKEQLYEIVDEFLVPYVQAFVFDSLTQKEN